MRIFIPQFPKVFVTLLGMILLCSGCGESKKNDTNPPKLLVINLLDKALYNDCHIAGSVHVPFTEIEAYAQSLHRQIPIVVYCSNYQCTASGQAYKQLKKMGFEYVWAYEGGMAEWYQLKYPVAGSCSMKYLTKEVPMPDEDHSIEKISAQELKSKMEMLK